MLLGRKYIDGEDLSNVRRVQSLVDNQRKLKQPSLVPCFSFFLKRHAMWSWEPTGREMFARLESVELRFLHS